MEETLLGILERNKRVEAEKAWERSLTRRVSIAAITFLTASVLLWILNEPRFLLGALVPMAGYLLSTLSLPWIKRRWMRSQNGD